MKRWYPALAVATLAAGLCGLALSMTLGSDIGLRGALSQGLILASLAGLVGTALLRPRYQREKAVGVAEGAVSQAERARCGFGDVAANSQALRSLTELKDYLVEPEKYARYGARMPKGVLLYGPPGTGKTLMARALAGEAGVPFFALSGSDFVEKYVGVGASRVRELFKRAHRAGRCVIFIDEIDAMGKRRDEASSDERDQTLNALLSEMSGFHTGDGVVVIAATNRMEALDPALLRPGRFDRQIEVGMPGRDERLSILKLHGRNKPISDAVDLSAVAAQTVGFSGASLESLLNEAAILAAIRESGEIGQEDVDRAFCRAVAGEDQPCAASARERRSIAVHEAGHALASHLRMPESRLARVSILPAGHGAAGYNLTVPPERVMPDKRELERQIDMLLAGRAAEAVCFGEQGLTAGASSDIARATELASAMVMELGLAGDPAVSERVLGRQCGGANDAAARCRQLLNGRYRAVCEMLAAHRRALDALSRALLASEALTGDEARRILSEALSSESQRSA